MFMTGKVLSAYPAPSVPLYLAPQAGVSESPFRHLCRRFGADVVLSEFVSAEGILHGNDRTMDYLRFDEDERPIGVQIFGAHPSRMADAAAFVADTFRPDFIDINFGCPVKKVVKRNGGVWMPPRPVSSVRYRSRSRRSDPPSDYREDPERIRSGDEGSRPHR